MAGFGRAKQEKARQQKNLRNKKSLLREAIEFHNQGDLHNAEKAYRSAIKSGLKDFNLLFNLGLICQGSQRTDEAISFYKEAITQSQ